MFNQKKPYKSNMIPKYINFYLHKITIKIAFWQRYTNSRLFLGEGSKVRTCLLAYALCNKW